MTKFLIMAMLLVGCSGSAAPTTADAVDWMIEHTPNYLEDTSWRRAELEASMWMPDLPYARKRLDAYALESGGWDRLPEYDPVVWTVGENPERIEIPTELPADRDGWLALGEQVFWNLPMRRDGYLEWLVNRPDEAAKFGLQTDDRGNLRGLVRYEDPTVGTRVAVTCGLCHGDQGVAGAPNQRLDLGGARAALAVAHGGEAGPEGNWGPGTVDVTDDQIMDAVAIPNLWSLENQQYINRSGAVALASPASIAIRFETQYIEGHAMMTRPPRVLTWALAMYVHALSSPTTPDMELPGYAVFERECVSCHQPDEAFGGGLFDAAVLNSNPRAAQSPLRGTGMYKIPALIGVSNQTRFMNDASVESLETVVSGGHPFGQKLSESDQHQLLEFLHTL